MSGTSPQLDTTALGVTVPGPPEGAVSRRTLDPRTAVAILLAASITVMAPGGLLFVPAALVAGMLLAIAERAWRRVLALPLAAATAAAVAYLLPLAAPWPVLGIVGVMGGFSLRLVAVAGIAAHLIETMPPTRFTAALRSMRVPHAFTVSGSVLLRFVPTILAEARAVRDAMRLRGLRRLAGHAAPPGPQHRVLHRAAHRVEPALGGGPVGVRAAARAGLAAAPHLDAPAAVRPRRRGRRDRGGGARDGDPAVEGRTMIELKNVRWAYQEGDTAVLDGLDLRIRRGETVVVCGPSGSGKSSALRLMNGLIPHFHDGKLEGEVRVAGEPITDLAQVGRVTGTVLQHPRRQFFTDTIDTELAFALENFGTPPERIRERVREVVAEFRLGELDGRLRELSGGQQQRVACAAAVTHGRQALLLDEPTSNLSPQGIADLTAVLRHLRERGTTLVIAEHRLHYLRELADRIVVMQDGRVAKEWSRNNSPG
ncbi:Vitamin B12 import ATP-binding protein BtuD [Streptomyces glaucescens]